MARLEELVSDWELQEISEELGSGTAPDVVAFRHGVGVTSVRAYARKGCTDRWTDAELAFVRDNYPAHGEYWPGWTMLKRSWATIVNKAALMGVRRRHLRWTEEDDALLRDYYPTHGPSWSGWKSLMPCRPNGKDNLAKRASALGIRYEGKRDIHEHNVNASFNSKQDKERQNI